MIKIFKDFAIEVVDKIAGAIAERISPTPSLAECTERARAGDPEAQSDLATYYIRGEAVPRDYEQAIALLTASAEAGYPGAQYSLGNAYFLGQIGQAKDYVRGYAWYSVYVLCSPRLRSFGQEQRQELEEQMTPQQISEAQRLSKTLLAKVESAENRWRPSAA